MTCRTSFFTSLRALPLLVLVAGCSPAPKRLAEPPGSDGRSPSAPRYGDGFDSRSSTPSARSAPYPAEAPSAALESGSSGPGSTFDASRARDEAPFRPGLATSWGELRSSPIQSTYFERRDPSAPSAWAEVRYDDEVGIRHATQSYALHLVPHEVPLLGGAVVMRVVDDDADPLPSVPYGPGSFVVAEDGERYQILIENRTDVRFEVVATVDGLDVIDGRPGAFEKRGYLVGPRESLAIDGFRTSEDGVAAFRFGRVHESYAAARGDASNVGVIGVALFDEENRRFAPPPTWPTDAETERRGRARSFPGRFAPAP